MKIVQDPQTLAVRAVLDVRERTYEFLTQYPFSGGFRLMIDHKVHTFSEVFDARWSQAILEAKPSVPARPVDLVVCTAHLMKGEQSLASGTSSSPITDSHPFASSETRAKQRLFDALGIRSSYTKEDLAEFDAAELGVGGNDPLPPAPAYQVVTLLDVPPDSPDTSAEQGVQEGEGDNSSAELFGSNDDSVALPGECSTPPSADPATPAAPITVAAPVPAPAPAVAAQSVPASSGVININDMRPSWSSPGLWGMVCSKLLQTYKTHEAAVLHLPATNAEAKAFVRGGLQ